MKCTSCGGEDFHRPEVPCAIEQWECVICGSKMDVHCHYLPDISGIPRHDLFRGFAIFESDDELLKAFLKLKHALKFAERCSANSLEAQYLKRSLQWDLGEFLDLEVERAEAECMKAGVNAQFIKLV